MSNRKNKKKSSDLLPENCQLEICGASGFGDLMAAAIDPTDNPHGYKIYVLENKKIKPALAEGDRFIARLSRKNDTWWAKPLARTMTAGVALEQIYGVIVEKNGLFYLRSAERNSRMDYLLDKLGSSHVGDFVKVALIGEKKFKQAKIIKNYGRFNIAKSTGLFILEKYKINDFIYAGGVSCSSYMRSYLSEHMYKDLNIVFGKPEMSADNAIGTALLGGKKIWL